MIYLSEGIMWLAGDLAAAEKLPSQPNPLAYYSGIVFSAVT